MVYSPSFTLVPRPRVDVADEGVKRDDRQIETGLLSHLGDEDYAAPEERATLQPKDVLARTEVW